MNFSNNVRSSCILVGSGGEADATTPNNVRTEYIMEYIMERIRIHHGKDTIRLCKPCVMHVCGPNNVGRAVQTNSTLLLMLWQSQNKTNVGSCRLKSLTGFKLCVTNPNNTQQHAAGCANGYNM